MAGRFFLLSSEEKTWMVTPLRLPDIVPGVVPTVVAALDLGIVQGDGVAGGIKSP